MSSSKWMTDPAGKPGLGGCDVLATAGRSRLVQAARERLQGTGLPIGATGPHAPRTQAAGRSGADLRTSIDNTTPGFPPSRSTLS